MDLWNIYLLEIPFDELSLYLFHPKLGPGHMWCRFPKRGTNFPCRGGGGDGIRKYLNSSSSEVL